VIWVEKKKQAVKNILRNSLMDCKEYDLTKEELISIVDELYDDIKS
jgi:DNA-binding transcriptional regulator YhcF (GntR family)